MEQLKYQLSSNQTDQTDLGLHIATRERTIMRINDEIRRLEGANSSTDSSELRQLKQQGSHEEVHLRGDERKMEALKREEWNIKHQIQFLESRKKY